MKLVSILFLIGLFFSSNALTAENCSPSFDDIDFEIIGDDVVIASGVGGSGDIYVYGSVTLEGNNKNATYDGSIYATGDIYVGKKVTVTGFAYSEGTFSQHNQGNVQVIKGSCSEGDVIPVLDLPIEELAGQCNDIFYDAIQSYSIGHLIMYSAQITDEVSSFDFGTMNEYSSGVCSAGTCTVTGESSSALSAFSISPITDGQDITAQNKNQTVGGSDDDYTGTVFGDIYINGRSVTFSEQSDPLNTPYLINSIDLVNSSSELILAPGIYAVNEFNAGSGGEITIGTDHVYLFIENLRGNWQVNVNGDPEHFHLIVNEGFTFNGGEINGSLYMNGDITINSNVTINGKLASQDLTMNGGTINNNYYCSSGGNDEYTFTYDGTQPQALTCEAHPVEIQARLNDVIDTSYINTINISTSTGLGDWSITDADSAKGTLDNGTAGDGVATYQFVGTDNGEIELALTHDVGDTTITISNDDAAQTYDLNFSSAVLKTELSCVDDSLGPCINTSNLPFTLTLSAFKEDELTNQCVNYDPTNILFWSEYDDPSSPTGLFVEVEGSEIGKSEGDATAFDITFTDGVATVDINYPDAGQIIIHAQDADSADIDGEVETILNPLELIIESISSSNGNSNPETTDTGNGFMRASVADYDDLVVDTFDLTVTAVKDCSNDVKGHCSGIYGERTPSFEAEINLQTSLLFPDGGVLGDLQYDGDDGFKVDLTSGQFTYANLAYDEVGTIGVEATTLDGYLVTNNDIETTEVQSIGRFYPDYLAFGNYQISPACNNDFTYLGQEEVKISFNLQAYQQAESPVVTQNYDQVLGYSVAPVGNFSDAAYDQTPLSLTTRLLRDSYYDESAWSGGLYSVTEQLIGIDRILNTPDGPYELSNNNLIDYFIKLVGYDGEKIKRASDDSCTNDECVIGDLGNMVYGRLQAGNGHGSEFQPIRTLIEATYFNGVEFVPFDRDSCTPIVNDQLSATPDMDTSNNIVVGSSETTLSILNSSLISGKGYLQFSAPDDRGTLDYFIRLKDLADSGIFAPWLLDSGNAVTCPDETGTLTDCISGQVNFGLFRGNDRIIYRMQTFD